MSKDKKASSVMRQIDENLRRVYFDQPEDVVPDRFQKLLEQLKQRDEGAGNE